MEDKLRGVQHSYLDKISAAKTLKELDDIFLALFGKKGELTLIPKEFSTLSADEKKKVGPLFNSIKQQLEEKISSKRQEIREESYRKLADEDFEIDSGQVLRSRGPQDRGARMTNLKKRKGHLHPLTVFEKEIADLFGKIGFSQYDAPHIDTDEINFQLLNIPQDHPARDLQDTLYLDTSNLGPMPGRLLLRTHTSNAQIRSMREFKPSFRIMNIGRCFRHENLDARHEHTFDQFEIVYVDKNVTMANLQYLSEYFLQNVFGKDVRVRLRPKYYPFVEPGAGVDGLCIFCKGKGCKVCGGIGWLELGGSGMIHPQVLKNGGIDPKIYTGIAWGCSPDRMVMLKYGIEDIRLLRSGDLSIVEKLK